MNSNVVNFTINVDGNAYKGIVQLDDAFKNVMVDAQQMSKSFINSFKELMSLDSITNIVSNVSQAFSSLVGSSLEFEQQQANLKTLLNGDAEATSKLVGQIKEYSKATTYDTSGLVDAQKTMMAFGLDAEYAFGKLKNIGDIAMGDRQKMDSLALAFSQMSSTGKLMGQDLLQMINAGFNPLEVISQKTGKSIGELKEEMGKGAISAEMVAQAFEWATEEGGRFYNGASAASETTAGKIAKMNKTIDDLKIKLFETTGGATAWIAEMGNVAVPIAQILPLISGLNSIIKKVKDLNFAGMMSKWKHSIEGARISLAFMRKDIATCNMANLGFIRNTIRAAMAVGRFATVGLFNALKGMGAYILSLVTGGAASKTFSTIASASFAKFSLSAKAACKAVSVAIGSIPVVGWIAIGVTAIGAFVAWLYSQFESVRGWFDGIGSAILGLIPGLGLVINIITSLIKHWESVKTAFTDGGILSGLKRIGFVLIDALLKPIQALLELIAKIPGLEKLAGKGADWIQSMRDSLDKKTYVAPVEKAKGSSVLASDQSVLTPESANSSSNATALNGGEMGKSAGVSAGKAQQITIKLENMVGTMNFNGGLRENAHDIESILMEGMARILGMASTAM